MTFQPSTLRYPGTLHRNKAYKSPLPRYQWYLDINIRLILRIKIIYWLYWLGTTRITKFHLSKFHKSLHPRFTCQVISAFSSHQYSGPKTRWRMLTFCCASRFADWGRPKRAEVWCAKVIFPNWNVSTPKAPKSKFKSWMTPSDFTRLLRSESWNLEIANQYWGNVDFKSQGGHFFWIWCDLSWKNTQTHAPAPHQQLPCATKKPVRRYMSPCWHSMRVQWPKCTHWLCGPPKNARKQFKGLPESIESYPSVRGKARSLN